MNARVKLSSPEGSIMAPSSKSFTQRYILYSAFSNKKITLNNISFCNDELVSIDIAKKCNATVKYDKKNVTIEPDFICPTDIYFGESGTSYRLGLGLVSGRKCNVETYGDPSLARRPIDDLLDCFSRLNIKFFQNDKKFYNIDASHAVNNYCVIDGKISSQFVSSLLFYYSFFDSGKFGVKNQVSENYIDITMKCLGDFGVSVYRQDNEYALESSNKSAKNIDMEGDYSSISYFIVLAIFKGDIIIKNLKKNSLQPDSYIIKIINDACNAIETFEDCIKIHKIKDIKSITLDVARVPDLAPIIATLGIFSSNGVRIINYHRLSKKESNRFLNILDLVKKFGAITEVDDYSILIKKGTIKNPKMIEYDDHRMVMSAIIAGLISESDTLYGNIEAINKSYPEFLNDLKKIGAEITFTPSLSK